MKGWIQEVSENVGVLMVAREVGLQNARGRSLKPCPACGSDTRGSHDNRGPIGVRGDGKGWHCHVSGCGASGDALELAVLVWYGKRLRELSADQRHEVRDRCAGLSWCSEYDPDARNAGKPTPRFGGRRKEKERGWSIAGVSGPQDRPQPEPPRAGTGWFDWRPELPEECQAALWGEEGAQVLAYLQERGFSADTLRHWGFGAHLLRQGGMVVEQYVALPVPRRDGKIVGMRFRSVPGTCLRCDGAGCPKPRNRRPTCKDGKVIKAYLRCNGQDSTLFGVHQLDGDEQSEVVITEGEFDVVALWQYGLRRNVVSGTAGAGTWAEEWLDELEPYRHFVLAYDDDDKGNEGSAKVAQALGLTRCSRAVLPGGDAAQAMQDCVSQAVVHAALDKAEPLMNLSLRRVGSYRTQFRDLIANPDRMRGLPTGSDKLDKAIGGWYGLVVVTGDTAAGKTSFTTWAGLEQALRGVGTLLTSFEQQPIGLVQKLMRQQLQGDFTKCSEQQHDHAFDQLDRLPLHLLDHYGELNATQCLQALDYANRRLGVRFAVVDHLGFLVREAEDERRAIEEVVRKYAIFSVQRHMTIVLICHPSNLNVVQQRRVKISDIKGASAVRQDAHLGLVIERLLPGKMVKHPASAVHVDKCRSEFGMQGARCTLFYDPEATVYADTWEQTPMGVKGKSGGFRVEPEATQVRGNRREKPQGSLLD